MPCTDGGPSRQQIRDGARIAPALCGMIRAWFAKNKMVATAELPENLVFHWDTKESGVSLKWLASYWRRHFHADQERIVYEKKARLKAKKQAKLVASAKKKLTPAERAALKKAI